MALLFSYHSLFPYLLEFELTYLLKISCVMQYRTLSSSHSHSLFESSDEWMGRLALKRNYNRELYNVAIIGQRHAEYHTTG